jgi:hypothetical protein
MPVIVRGYDTDDISQSRKKKWGEEAEDSQAISPQFTHMSPVDISVLEAGNIVQ